MPDLGAIHHKWGPMDYNAAQKWCHTVSGSDPQAEIMEWKTRREYQLLNDLSGGNDVWVGFTDWGHPGVWRDGKGEGKPDYVPFFAGQEILLDANTHPDADCAYFEASSSLVKLGDCLDATKFFYCDE